jgi:phage terminase small subunit
MKRAILLMANLFLFIAIFKAEAIVKWIEKTQEAKYFQKSSRVTKTLYVAVAEPAPVVKKEKPPKPVKPPKAIEPVQMPEPAPQTEPEKPTEAKDPPKTHLPPAAPSEFEDPLDFMQHVMNNQKEDMRLRLDAAKAWANFKHAKPGEKGKKENAKEEAERIAGKSKYTPGAKPRLVASN